MHSHKFSHRDPRDLDGAPARKGLMLGVLALIAVGAMVVAEPALSAGPVMSPSAGTPPPKAPGAILPGGGAPTVGVPTVVAPQVPLGASALPTTTAPKGFPTGGNVPTATDPIPGIDVVVTRKNQHGIAMKLRTDGTGGFTLGALTPGEYVIQLPGDSLRSAVDRLDAKRVAGNPTGPTYPTTPIVGVNISLPANPDARIEHRFTGTTTGGIPHIQFTVTTVAVGTDTTPTAAVGMGDVYVSTIDWGDGSPPAIFDRWGNLIFHLPNTPDVNAAVVTGTIALLGTPDVNASAKAVVTGDSTDSEFKKRKHSYKGIVTLVR